MVITKLTCQGIAEIEFDELSRLVLKFDGNFNDVRLSKDRHIFRMFW